ncbi:YncE family protein [soil metagenome]
MTARLGRVALAALAAFVLAGCAGATAAPAAAGATPNERYLAYVVSESADRVARIRFGADGARVERSFEIGTRPTEIDGPHGVAASPDGRYVYVTIGHGTPWGSLWKITTSNDSVVSRVTLGDFPATVDVSPDGQYGFVSNFNLHGDMVPSSISKVHLPTMAEVARTVTCVMPHGSRVNAQGTLQYSACMMDDQLVEIDAGTGHVARRFSVAPGREGPAGATHAGHTMPAGSAAKVCSPTWAQPSADGSRVYVACNRTAEVLEVDARSWALLRRFATGEAPYNLAATPDGRYLLVTLKNRAEPGTELIDLAAGRTVSRIPATTVLPHGVAVTPDSRFAVVSVEGVGSEPGRVDVLDLRSLRRVGSVEVGQQAGGIAVVAER